MLDPVEFELFKAANRAHLDSVIDELAELQTRIEAIRKPSEWYSALLAKLIVRVAFVCQDLLQVAEQKHGLPAAAWNARNLLELLIWAEYCCASKENARRFHEDALRDSKGMPDSLSKLDILTRSKNQFEEQARKVLADTAHTQLGITLLDSDYEKVHNAAAKIGLGEWFAANNKYLSKFAHPTALLVIGMMHQTEVAAVLQWTFVAKGLDFAPKARAAFEKMASQVQTDRT